jgi:hypothetical protein
MNHAADLQFLESAARTALGEPVMAAGIFSWQDLLEASMVGGTAGAVGAGMLSDNLAAVGAVVGGRVAVESKAAANGMTTRLLVTVTADTIYVLNWLGDHAGDVVHRFDRATTEVHISKFGLSRILRLHDTASGEELELHGTAAPYLGQTKADKTVLHLLDAG